MFTKSSNESQKLEKNWSGQYPYLHLIHALIDNNDVKHTDLSRHDIPSGRLTIEKQNHDDGVLSVWQMMANYWNDQKFTLETQEIPDLHSNYSMSEKIMHESDANMHMATPE